MPRPVPSFCIDFVKHFEGCSLKAYHDPAAAPNIWTIGWGHTADEGPPIPSPGTTITQKQADDILAADLARHAAAVESLVRVPINDSMFAALVSFAFNLGDKNLRRSTLLNRVNARRFQDAVGEFGKWNHANGVEVRGLTRRRLSEANLFCSFPNPIITDLASYRRNRTPLTVQEAEALSQTRVRPLS